MNKLTLRIESFTPHCKNTLRGFATVTVSELHLIINDIGIHTKNGHSWASLPAKPWVKNGEAVVDDTGKIKYLPILEFDNNAVRDAFSTAVVKALLEHDPRALICKGMS